jgi:hypothetical protein
MKDLCRHRELDGFSRTFRRLNGKRNFLGFPQEFPQHGVKRKSLLSDQLTGFQGEFGAEINDHETMTCP